MRDFYEILNVSKNSSKDEIKKAYRKIAMKYHPDRNPDNKQAEEKFKEAAEAYSVLSDDSKKAQYDQFGHAGLNQGFGSGGGFSGGINVEDIFNSVFGGGGGFGDIFGGGFSNSRKRNFDGNDLKIKIPLTLEEVFEGTSKTIKIKRWEKSGENPTKCLKCNGTGEMRFVQKSFLGQIVNVKQCDTCDGLGQSGGRIQKTANVKIEIPAGVSDGNYMTMEGEGDRSIKGGSNGDLIVYFEEKNHQLFSRSSNDIYVDCWIDYHDAILGVEIKVPTLSGFVKMKVPSGVKNGQLLRLKNKGISEVNRYKTGDQYVRMNIDIPDKISKEVSTIIKSLKDAMGENVSFKKIKN